MAIQQGTVTITGFVGSMRHSPRAQRRSRGMLVSDGQHAAVPGRRNRRMAQHADHMDYREGVQDARVQRSHVIARGGGGDRDRCAQHGGMDDPER